LVNRHCNIFSRRASFGNALFDIPLIHDVDTGLEVGRPDQRGFGDAEATSRENLAATGKSSAFFGALT
jgi:hypothetical protein